MSSQLSDLLQTQTQDNQVMPMRRRGWMRGQSVATTDAKITALQNTRDLVATAQLREHECEKEMRVP